MSKELAKLTRKADAVAISASRLLSDQIKIIQGEIASWGKKLNIAASAKDREVIYELIRKRMKQLSRKLDALMAAQNELAGKTAAKVASNMTGLDIKYSAKRAEAITELVTPAQGENLAAVFTERMSNHLINTLRQATVEALREQAIAGGTLKELSKELAWKWIEKAKEPPVFVDAGGKAWNTQTYFQMQSRTNSMRIYNDCLIDDVARETGSDIMRISRGGDPNCHCFAWEGCVISISGKTKGLPTYEQARKGGCFHPNCTHTLEYVDEAIDSDEIELAKSHPVVQGKEDDADAQYDRRREIDIARKMRENGSISRSEAEVLVDRDNLADAIRTGLVRSDARQIVDALTDAQVRALITNGRTPRFEPTKKATKEDPHAADEKWIHGKRGGVVHISRTATVEDLIKVTGVENAKMPEPAKVEKPKAEKAVEHTIVQGRNLESFVGSPDAGVSLTKQIIQEQGFDGKPLIIDDEAEFDRLAQKSGIMGYRGLGDGAEIPNYVKALREGDFYVECTSGGRVNGRGLYFAVTGKNGTNASTFSEADTYATRSAELPQYKGNSQKYIFKATVSDDIKIAPKEEIQKLRKDWVIEKLRPYALKAISQSGYSGSKYSKFLNDIFASDKYGNGSGIDDGILDKFQKKHKKLWEAFNNQGIDFRGIIESDIGTIAAEKGFDALIAHDVSYNEGVDYLVLLNRTKLILFDKEAKNVI